MIDTSTQALLLDNGDKFTVKGDRNTVYTVIEEFENDDKPIRVENIYGKTVINPYAQVWPIRQKKKVE